MLTPNIDPGALSDQELLDLIDWLEAHRLDRPRPVGIIGIPSGFSVPRGVGFVAGALTNRRDRRFSGDFDGSFAFGYGFGDARRGIAVTPLVDITSVTPSKFGTSGKISVKLARQLALRTNWVGSIGLSLENLITWGDSDVLDPAVSLAYSAVRPAGPGNARPIMISLGYGTGISNRGTEPGAFAGLGVGLSEFVGMSVGWYGDEAIAGVNLWPDEAKNMQISLGIGDISNRVDGRRLLLSVSLSRPFGR
ncbi:MAG: hypothetical protein AB3N11_15215 [Arenibacterium sp.]